MNFETALNPKSYNQRSFVEKFGGLYEHSPWVAEQVWSNIDINNITFDALSNHLRLTVEKASDDQKLVLLRAHPELAGKAATEGKLTRESTDEQSRARLDLCSPSEYEKFQQLNSAYNDKFKFPFIMAVRNSTRSEILAAFESRLNNSWQEEFATALEQVHQIAKLRLEAYLLTNYGETQGVNES